MASAALEVSFAKAAKIALWGASPDSGVVVRPDSSSRFATPCNAVCNGVAELSPGNGDGDGVSGAFSSW